MRTVLLSDILEHLRRWKSIVVVGTSYGMKCFGFEFRQEKYFFFLFKNDRTDSGAHPPSLQRIK